jgi:hypothetical protein
MPAQSGEGEEMRTALLVVAVVALVAAAAWALAGSRPASTSYTVEVSDVAGVRGLVVSPEVVAAVPGPPMMPEVVARANQMPEVVVRATGLPEVAGLEGSGSEVLN